MKRLLFLPLVLIPLAGCGTALQISPAASIVPAATLVPATPTPVPVPQVVLDQSGSGTATTNPFTVGDNWKLTYTYDCAGERGNFIVGIYAGDQEVEGLVNDLGTSGGNTDPEYTAGTYHFKVVSECNWHITVEAT